MNRWPPETRSRLLFVVLVTGSLMALVWFSVIAPLQGRVNTWTNRVELTRMQLQLAQTSVDRADHYRNLVEDSRSRISALEERMARGDLYAWVLTYVSSFADRFDIQLAQFILPQVGAVNLPPEVPYRLGLFAVTGWAHYHSFGTFLAAFENSSPFLQVKSVTLASTGSGVARSDDPERLSFRLEFYTLANTNAPGLRVR